MADASFWNLRLNLDKLNGLNNRCRTDAERLLVFQGFLAGCNGAEGLDDDPPAFRRGWELGAETHQEAKRYHQAQSERGKASAEKRRERTGSAQPSKPETTTVRTAPEPPFEPPFEPRPEPNHNPQSTIQETTNNKPSPPTPQGGALSQVVDLWNEATEGTPLPKARLTPTRSRTIATRMREHGWLDDFRAAVGFIRLSSWHKGGNDRGWIANIDFVLQPGKATQLAEKARSPVVVPKPQSRGGPPSIRRTMDQEWAEANPQMLEPYQPEEDSEPAY